MKKVQSPLALALLFGALLLFAFIGTMLVSGPIGFLFRNAPGLQTVRNVTQIAALLAAACLFVAASIVAIPAALQPARWSRKLLDVLPVYSLGFTLVGVILSILSIGTVGTVFNLGMVRFSFATAWLTVGAVLSAVAVTIAAARMHLGERILRVAMTTLSIASVPSLITWLGMAISLFIVLTSEPSLRPTGGPGGPQETPPPPGPGGPGGSAALLARTV